MGGRPGRWRAPGSSRRSPETGLRRLSRLVLVLLRPSRVEGYWVGRAGRCGPRRRDRAGAGTGRSRRTARMIFTRRLVLALLLITQHRARTPPSATPTVRATAMRPPVASTGNVPHRVAVAARTVGSPRSAGTAVRASRPAAAGPPRPIGSFPRRPGPHSRPGPHPRPGRVRQGRGVEAPGWAAWVRSRARGSDHRDSPSPSAGRSPGSRLTGLWARASASRASWTPLSLRR